MAGLSFIWLMLAVFLFNRGDGELLDVRLVDGTKPTEGTVMYTLHTDCEIWNTTCGINLDVSDVIVICRHLGFAGANRPLKKSPFGGSYHTPKTHIECNGDGGSISNCSLAVGCTDNSVGGAACYGSNYLGCFKDMKSNRVLNGPQNQSFQGLTIDKCLEFCRLNTGMVLAGVEYGQECYCGNATSNYNQYGRMPDRYCQSECNGSQYESCGGIDHIAIFNLTADPQLPPSPMNSPCDMNAQPATTISNTFQTTSLQETSSLPGASFGFTDDKGVTVTTETGTPDIGSNVPTFTKIGFTTSLISPPTPIPPAGNNKTTYAAIGGGVAGAVVICIIVIVIVLVYRRRRKAKEGRKNGLDLHDTAPVGTAAPIGHENAIGYFPDASGGDALRMDMNDDQQEEVEKDAFTAQMKRGTMLVEYVNMKDRDNSGVLEPEASLNVSYENTRVDSSDKSAVTSKAEQEERRPEPGEQAMAAGSLYTIPEKNRKSQMSHQGPAKPLPDDSTEDAGILYGIPEKKRKSKLSQSVPVLPLSDNADAMYAIPNKPRFGRVDSDTTEMVENELYG